MSPKSLKIFLPAGIPTGLKIIELSNWIGKAYIMPRTLLDETLQRSELNSQALYFLLGTDDNEDQIVYVGEAENFRDRLIQHNKNKDFWHTAIAFISKDDNLTKAHVRFLEFLCVRDIVAANRIKLENGNIPNGAKLSESDKYEIEEFYNNIKVVLSTFGYNFLENVTEPKLGKDEIYYCKGKGVSATMKITDEGYVLLKGTTLYPKDSESLSEGLKRKRSEILQGNSVQKLVDGKFQLTENLLFTSPSTAMAVVLGRSENGWMYWKDENGNSLDFIKRQNLES